LDDNKHSMSEPILQLKNISAHYSGIRALDNVSITIDPGQVIALMGPNGAGKSTVLKSIFGLVDISGGEVILRGQPVIAVPHKIVQEGVSFVPQGRRVFASLTVEENLEMGGFVVRDKKELARRMDEVMTLFPALKAKRKDKSRTLSGGQQQMVALARGLMTRPDILLLDEPSLGLAPKIVKEIFVKIRDINRAFSMSIVIVEHNIKSLLEIVDRAYVLDKGTIIAEGEAKQLVNSDILQKVFLGKLE
jgi:branched-chain amino acid transport system ATP-binding protein